MNANDLKIDAYELIERTTHLQWADKKLISSDMPLKKRDKLEFDSMKSWFEKIDMDWAERFNQENRPD